MKEIVLILASMVFITGGISTAEADTRILSMGMGSLFGYNLSTDNLGTAQELTIGFGLAEDLEAGFHFITGDGTNFPTYNLFSLSYTILQRMGLTVFGGRRTAPAPVGAAMGMGYYFNIFHRDFQEALSTILKLRVEYLVSQTIPVEKGLLSIGLQAKIAF